MSVVYFISDGEYIKIGQSSNLLSRLSSLQCANPRELTVLHTIECDDSAYISKLETKLHKHFKEYRVAGEWFSLDWQTAYSEIVAIHSGLKDEIEKRNQDMSEIWLERQRETQKKALQMRFDELVDDDLRLNYPPMKKFPRRNGPRFGAGSSGFGARFANGNTEKKRFTFDIKD
jgi:hypothetical protein